MEQKITPDGVKGTIILPAAPAGDAIWDFELVLSGGLTPVQEFGQPILVKDAKGAVVAIVPQGLAIDSKGAKTVVEEVLRQAKGNRWVVSFAVDVAWLDDPARSYPVMVDPTVQLGAGGAYNKYLVGTQYGTQIAYYNYDVWNSGWNGSGSVWSQPDLSAFAPGMQAILQVNYWGCYNSGGQVGGWTRIEAATSAWDPATLTWANQPATQLVGDMYTPAGTPVVQSFNVTAAVYAWKVLGINGTPGFRMSSLTPGNYCTIANATLSYDVASNVVPTGTMTPATGATVGVQPTFTGTISDPDGPGAFGYIMWCYPSFAAPVACNYSGWIQGPSLSVTAPVLPNSQAGAWRYYVSDGQNGAVLVGENTFQTIPPPFGIPSRVSPTQNQVVGPPVGVSTNVTFTAGAPNPAGAGSVTYQFKYCLVGGTCQYTPWGSGTQTVTVSAGSAFTWSVTAKDAAGQTSTSTDGAFTTLARGNNPPSVAVPQSPANGATGVALTATVSATATDPDGDPVRFRYTVCETGTTVCQLSAGYVSGAWAPSLTANTTYTWVAESQDVPPVPQALQPPLASSPTGSVEYVVHDDADVGQSDLQLRGGWSSERSQHDHPSVLAGVRY